MNGEAETEAPRPRPLSGGLWTLFSWLRRDERSSSSDSLSSVGSDRTTASFAFLAPAQYHTGSTPLVVPPPGPPTDSYKKRVRDRNIRRQHDRDITLHRKYGLYGSGYDAFSLPPSRKINGEFGERERRAASECLQRRSVHVPGKRRAPLPPTQSATSSLGRNHTRKRRAPQPPINIYEKNKENIRDHIMDKSAVSIQANSKLQRSSERKSADVSMGCKSEKYIKKDSNQKDIRTRSSEKGFLKQIFENRKRNSAIESPTIKLLPSISELDKQAAEIIENNKLKETEHIKNQSKNGFQMAEAQTSNSQKCEGWICTRCLRKYNSSIVACLYCRPTSGSHLGNEKELNKKKLNFMLPNNDMGIASSSNHKSNEDKQKLKEMLKEMKDSLPKRPKHDQNIGIDKNVGAKSLHQEKSTNLETPTLRIGTPVLGENNVINPTASSKDIQKEAIKTNVKLRDFSKNVLVTEQLVFKHSPPLNESETKIENKTQDNKPSTSILNKNDVSHESVNKSKINILYKTKPETSNIDLHDNSKNGLHTPLKISSLLNPFYIPKPSISNVVTTNNINLKEANSLEPKILIKEVQKNIQTSNNIDQKESKNLKSSESQDIQKNIKLTNSEPAGELKLSDSTKIIEKPENTDHKDLNVEKDTPSKDKEMARKSIVPNPSTKVPDVSPPASSSKVTLNTENSNNVKSTEKLDLHARRRDLINQLEQSIAQGDERAAAYAAVKLAQLRLSCSVLSFSSQIVANSQPVLNSSSQVNNVNKIPIKLEPLNDAKPGPSIVDEKLKLPSTSISKNNTSNSNDITTKINENISSKLELKSNIHEAKIPNIEKSSPAVASTSKAENNDVITVNVWVEDKEAARGPVHLSITRNALLSDLRRQAETSLGISARLQRWIVGRSLCTDDNTTILSLVAHNVNVPFYLCLVEPEKNIESKLQVKETEDKNKIQEKKNGNVYAELVELEQRALVPNAETFECGVCIEECQAAGGVILRECVHSFCRDCLSDVIRHSEEPAVSCPAMGCPGILQEREIRALVSPEDYEKWLARSLAAAESGTRNAFHCRTPDCTGWALCEPGVQKFPCPVCKRSNCIQCQAIHEGATCEEHRAKLQAVANTNIDQTDDSTRALLKSLIQRGEALECPECNAIITKKWGCDWIKCSACKTEICWVTRGRRWGPGGRGDTSGGCRCGVDGKRCHPSCGYCH